MTAYHLAAYFFIYGFLGWCTEVAFAAAKERRFVNRGFLFGPICPIYGFGVAAVVSLLAGVKDHIVILYFASVVLVTALEWLTGLLLEKVFHNKWWDYSNMPFNLNGYVCLLFSLIWGVICVFIVKILHPLVEKGVNLIPRVLGFFMLFILFVAVFADLYVTVSDILKFNRHLQRMEVIAKELHEISEEVGDNIYKGVMETLEWQEEVHEKLDKRSDSLKEKRAELHRRYRDMAEHGAKHSARLLKAFPHMESKHHSEILKEIKEVLKNRKH